MIPSEGRISKAARASLANSSNCFLQLPQEIHNLIFLRLVDLSNASTTSIVDHAGMHDISRPSNFRHIQCSTPTLLALLPMVYTCKQLHSEFTDTLAEFRAKTIHHFRILDDEDFHAYEWFFDESNASTLRYRLTQQLSVMVPAKSHHLPLVIPVLAALPSGLLVKLVLKLSLGQDLDTPADLLNYLSMSEEYILHLGSMTCTRLSQRRFDGIWTLQYYPAGDQIETEANKSSEMQLSEWRRIDGRTGHALQHASETDVRVWARIACPGEAKLSKRPSEE